MGPESQIATASGGADAAGTPPGAPPEASVILTTRNRRELLERTLASALGQAGVDLEVIVVDDHSSDGTAEYLRSLTDDRLEVIRQPERRGVSAARNEGIAAARGTWLAFLDDDDSWMPNRLRATIDVAGREGADYAYGAIKVVDGSGHELYVDVPAPPEGIDEALRSPGSLGGPSAVIARADFVREVGGFDPELAYVADWDMWLRFAASGRGARCPEVLVAYAQHEGSMLFSDPRAIGRELERFRERYPDIGREPAAFLRWIAYLHRGEGRRLAASRAYFEAARVGRDPIALLKAVLVLAGERPMRLARRIARRG
jgi:glycosyltransferase involved in cell wall biosynthesis